MSHLTNNLTLMWQECCSCSSRKSISDIHMIILKTSLLGHLVKFSKFDYISPYLEFIYRNFNVVRIRSSQFNSVSFNCKKLSQYLQKLDEYTLYILFSRSFKMCHICWQNSVVDILQYCFALKQMVQKVQPTQ